MVGLRGRPGCPQPGGRGDLDRTHRHVALKESLDPQIVAAFDRKGVAVVALPPSKVLKGKLALKCCQQYAMPEFEENIIQLDTGHARLMTPFFPLDLLRAIPGFENTRYEDPYAGGIGN